MADWVPFPDETLVEFFKAYTKYKWVFEMARQSIKPESRIVFPGFYIPPEWLAQLERPSREDQTSGESSIETSNGNAAPGKENVSHSQKDSVSKLPGNVLADVPNSARGVDERRSSYPNAYLGRSSGQMVAPHTEESSNNPSETQVTAEQVALMNSIIAEKIDEKLQQQAAQAFIDKITEAQVEDSNVRNAKIVERNVVTQQLVIEREAHARLEKELAQHKRLIKEQERELHRYHNSPHRHETTPQHRANYTHERHGPNNTRPTLPKFGESGYSYLVEHPEHGLPNRPNFDQDFRGQYSQSNAQLSNGFAASNMCTPNHQRTGRQMGTPGRQQMGPPHMGRIQITPPHMSRMQVTPPHMGPPQMGQRQTTPSHMRPPMAFQDARFSGPGNHSMGNPIMEQQTMQPTRQPRGPPQMGPEQMQVMGRPQTMGHPNMMAPPQTMGHFQAMAPPQTMRAQHVAPPNMMGPPSLAPPQMTAPPNMGQGQAMGLPPMTAPPHIMGPAQLMAPPNMGPAQEMRPRQMGHARITSQEARFIEQGNLFNDHGVYDQGADDFDNHHMAPPMAPPIAFPPFETQDIRMMDQRNHDFGNQQMGPPMGPLQLGPLPFDNGNFCGMDHGNQGFGNPEMGGPPACFGQMGNPIVRPPQFEDQGARSIGRSRGRKYGNDVRTTSPPMGPPNDDPSFLETEDLHPVGHNRNHHNAFGPPPPPVAPQTSLPQTTQHKIQHAIDAPPEMGPGYMTTHSPETARSNGRRGPGFASNSQAEPRYSTSPEDTPSSHRGARRFGTDQMMSNRCSTSPEEMRSSRRGAIRFIGNSQAAADRSSGSQEEPRPFGRRQENFDQSNMSPFSARVVRFSRSPEHTSPSHGLGIARAGNVSASPHDVRVVNEDRPHGRQLFQNFGPIGTRLPPPVFKFPDPAAPRFSTHPRPSGHPGRPSITDEHFTPFLPGRDLF